MKISAHADDADFLRAHCAHKKKTRPDAHNCAYIAYTQAGRRVRICVRRDAFVFSGDGLLFPRRSLINFRFFLKVKIVKIVKIN